MITRQMRQLNFIWLETVVFYSEAPLAFIHSVCDNVELLNAAG